MNIYKLIITFLIFFTFYLLVNCVSIEGINSPPPPITCNQERTPYELFSGRSYKYPDIDITDLDLNAEKYGYVRYYTNNNEIMENGVPVEYKWYRENSSRESVEVIDKHIQSILRCLYWKYNIKSIEVKKEICHRLSGFWAEYKYILNVRGYSGRHNAEFEWENGEDNLHYDERDGEMCYNFTGPMKKITAL